MTWKAYDTYVQSGLEWLVDLPHGWTKSGISALRADGENTFTDGDWVETPYITDSGIRLIQTGNVGTGEYREQGFRYVSESTFEELRCKEVLPGDLLICRLAEPVGRSCVAPDLGVRMITSVDVCILRTGEPLLTKYMNYVFNCSAYQGYVSSLVRGGTRDRVSRKMLGRFQVPMPPPDDISAITKFLDAEVRKIDALITKQEQLIATLREDRAATITHAVTKGLDPGVEMTESGVEWLGVTPAHWSSTKLAWNASCRSGEAAVAGSVEELSYGENGTVPVIGGNGIMGYTNTANLFDEAVVIGRVGALCGNVHLVDGPAWVTDNALLLKLRGNAFDRTYLWFLLTARRLNDLAAKTAQPLITGGQVSSLRLPLPPRDEQTQIVAHLTERCKTIDTLIAKATEVIATLREYRSALIADAVTGKIDVRRAA